MAAAVWRQRRRPPLAEASASSSSPGIVFECPDGRLGLHVVHTRFLISQAKATLLFSASRLQLMETFLLKSLRAQTSQRFVLYAAHDPKLPAVTLQPFLDALRSLGARAVIHAERTTAMELGFAALVDQLSAADPRVRNAELFVTSRWDLDDAAHVGAVEGVQALACGGGGEGAGQAVRVVYLASTGALWFPSASKGAYGEIRTPLPSFKIYRSLAIMQSLILSGAALLRTCPLNVYSYPHWKPQALEKMRVEGCAFDFSAERDILHWAPPAGELSWLYVKTVRSPG
jgi:hypothetical protein